MKPILVGIDGSPTSARALDLAADLAQRSGARLLIGNVMRPVLLSPYNYQSTIQKIREAQQKDSDALLKQAVRAAEGLGVSVAIRSLEGPPAETLIDVAEAEDAGLIVVGTRGRGAVGSLLLGSTSHSVVQMAKVPVLVVP